MPKQQQRMRRIEPRGQAEAMAALESRSNEELEAETRYKAVAQAILGQRAAERFDPEKARRHFQRSIAAARPQERMQFRRMADVALAQAERRPEDLRRAAERLGVEAPSNKQLWGLRIMGIVVPPASAGTFARVRGIVILLLAILAVLAAGFGIITGISAATGGLSLDLRIFWGIVLAIVVFVGLILFGRRRQKRAKAQREEKLSAARPR